MNLKTYQQQKRTIQESWFKNHKATFEDFNGILRLTWRDPDKQPYWCRYVIDGNILAVYGDIGEAVYGWAQKLTWEWLAGLDLDYFAGKCCASETGRRFEMWDHRKAEERIKEELSDPVMRKDWLEEAVLNCGTKGDWQMWLVQNGADAFGVDHVHELGDIGDEIHIRCQGHLIGIQMAIESANK